MNRTIHRLFAGVAAVGIALAGLATGAATANADVPTASTESGTITINGEGATGHTFSAYLIAAYNSNYSWSQTDDVSNLSLVLPSSTGTEISNVLQSSTGLTDINKLTGQDGTNWGLDSGTATSDVRKFAQALAADTANLGTAQTLSAGTNTVSPEGVYLIVDTTTLADGATTTTSVPMIVGSTLAKADAVRGTSTVASGTVDVKNTVITVHKQVVKDDGTTPNNNPSYKLGDTITFQLSTVIPNFSGYGKNATDPTKSDARVLRLTDTFSNGLTYDGITSVMVEGVTDPLAEHDDYDVTIPTTTTGGGTLTVDFGKLVNQVSGSTLGTNLSSYYGKKITVLVTAHLNSNAIIATAGTDTTVTGDDPNGNPNTVSVTFSNNPSDNSHKSTTPGDTVNVYSFKYTVKKTGQGADASGLSGAKFTIKDSTGNYLAYDSTTKQWSSLGTTEPTATSGTDSTTAGIFTSSPTIGFNGLKEDTYTVHEVQAPSGYLSINLPTFTFTITATYNNDTTNTTEASNSGDDSLKTLTYSAVATGTSTGYLATDGTDGTVTVKNFTSITQLPKTGAAGIALFSVIGLALVAAAAMFGIRARKASHLA